MRPTGTWRLTGPFSASAWYFVDGNRVVFEHDSGCERNEVGIYEWSSDGSTLRFSLVEDRCSEGRAYHFTASAWTRLS